MQGTYWLTVLPETSQLRPRIKKALSGVDRDATIRPNIDTKGARKAGVAAGREVQAGAESQMKGGLGKSLRIDGARAAGQNAGREVNAGLSSANIGRDAGSQLGANLTRGAEGIGRKLGGMVAGGLKIAAVGAGTVAAAGLGGALTAGFKRLTAIDDAKFKLQGLGNSTEKVQSIMDNALEAVDKTSFGLDEAATTAATAVAAGIQPGEQLTQYLKTTADAAGIAGTSMADMGSIFNKVQTSGKAFTGDLNMLADRGLPVFTWLQEATGKTGEEFQKMVEDGGISAEMFQKAIADNIGGAAQKMGGSVRGSLANLKASFSRFGAELSGPIFAGLKPLAIGLTGVFNGVTKSIKPIMADLTARVGPWAEGMAAKMKAWADNGGVEKIVAWFGRLRDTIAGLTSGGGSGAVSQISESVKTLGPAIQNAGPALGAMGEAMKAFGQAIATVGPETLSGILVPALQLLATTLKFVADNASWAVPVIGGLVLAMMGLRGVATVVAPVVSAFSNLARMFNAPLMIAQTAAIRAQATAMTQLTAALGTNAAAATGQAAAANAGAAATSRGRIATLAAAAASKVAAAAQWLWNAALTANPIGLIIAGVVAAGVAIWAFFTKTETGRKLWDKIWTGIKTTVSTVWNWLKTTLATAWAQIGPSVMKIGDVAKQAFGAFTGAVKTVWTAIQPAIAWIGRLWMSVAKLQFGVAIGALKALGAVIGWLWTNVVVPAFSGIASAVQTWWAGVQVVWGVAKTAIQAVGDVVMWLWHNVAEPGFAAIGSVISTWWAGVQTIWGLFKTGIEAIGTAVGVVKDAFVTGFNAIKSVVSTVWDFLSGIFEKIKGGVSGIVDGLRSIPGIGSLIPGNSTGRAPGFASGRSSVSSSGVVSGPGTGTSDSILALISNQEGIVTADAMKNGGGALVAALNAGWTPTAEQLHGLIPGFAAGLNPGADWLRSTIMQQWPAITNIGGKRSEDGFGEHSSGNAIDVMIPNYGSPEGKQLGDQVASWVAKNKDILGADGMIWRQTSFGYGGDWSTGKAMSSRGSDTQNHMDHVHIILGKGRGAGAASTDAPADTLSLSAPAGGSGSSLGSATSASAGTSRAVQTAQTAVKNAGQAVDDRTYARDKAQRKLDELKAAGKDTADAQHSLDVANRELADAKDRQITANDRLTEAQNKAATDGEKTSEKAEKGSDNGIGDLGKSIVSGFFETIGLDGSLFSNPFEWPTIKSAMAGVNVLGKALMGGEDGSATSGTSAGGDPSGILGGLADATGLGDMLTNLNPAAVDVNAAPAGNVAPDTTQHGAAAGANPGPAVVIENAGMAPVDVKNQIVGEFNARTRTTTTTG